jgi:formylglycine-generating enzyme required for sulfatase activity
MSGEGSGKIFINYRRSDDPGFAIALYMCLEGEFGAGRLFMDVDHIKPGEDFVEVLKAQVAQCDVLLAVIGPRWADNMASRVEDPQDFVAVEIMAALDQGKFVIPVLVGGVDFPPADILPGPIRPLARKHAVSLRPARFKADYQGLSAALKDALSAAESERTARLRSGPVSTIPLPMPGVAFQDFSAAPEMIVVPAGQFLMGSHKDEKGRSENEGPQRMVAIARPFAVSKFPVTFEEWDACLADGGSGGYKPSDNGWGRGRRPVINVSWEDTQNYVKWLSGKTLRHCRLLSEAEWEYAARAGETKAYSTGAAITRRQARFSEGDWGSAGRTVEAGSFEPNAFGLYDMHGNVGEWVEDFWHRNYDGAPLDGFAWCLGDPKQRVIRGGGWVNTSANIRAAYRSRNDSDARFNYVGFRVAAD